MFFVKLTNGLSISFGNILIADVLSNNAAILAFYQSVVVGMPGSGLGLMN